MVKNMIQVEMPKWIAMDRGGKWYLYSTKPKTDNLEDSWFVESNGCTKFMIIEVTGYTGTWQDSLHQFIDGQWRKV
jgi:hypothetical protein